MTVADLERSIAFWSQLLDQQARDRRLLDGPGLGPLIGYPVARIDSCWFRLPGDLGLELLQYLEPREDPNDPGTAHPGNVHICLHVGDITAARVRALDAGAIAVSPAPITVPKGPRAGTRIAYVRAPDGVTIELVQPAGDR